MQAFNSKQAQNLCPALLRKLHNYAIRQSSYQAQAAIQIQIKLIIWFFGHTSQISSALWLPVPSG